MYQLTVNFGLCKACMKCEVLLPNFRHVHGGMLRISQTSKEDEKNRQTAVSVVKGCLEGAVELRILGGGDA